VLRFGGSLGDFRRIGSWFQPLGIALIFIAGLSSNAYGQGRGMISGTVSDTSGATLPAATVVLTQTGTGITRSAVTENDGSFVLPSVPPATYSLTASAPGFKKYEQDGIALLADQSISLNIALELGVATEKVTVQGNVTQVDTTTATLKQVVDEKNIVDLPLNGRNAAVLTTLVAGAVPAPNNAGWDQGAQKTFPGVVLVSTNGSQSNTMSYLLDGGNNLDEYTNVNQPFPFPDALQEFSVQTSNYSARYGSNAGGVVNIITKSGSNQVHGDVFEFNRNAVFNARNFFASKRDQLKRNQFGGTIGGPVVIPGLYHGEDKTFFFGGYQGTRIRNITRANSAFVPTQAELGGDFSAFLDENNPGNPLGSAVQLNNPFTGQPIPGNIVDPSLFDPASVKIARSYLPQATTPNGQVFYANPVIQGFNEFLLRGDHSISDKDRVSARYFWDRFSFPPVYNSSNILTYAVGAEIVSQNFLIQETHTFQPNLLNEFRFNISPEQSHRGPAKNVPNVRDFGVNIPWQPEEKGVYRVAASGFFSFGANPSATFTRHNFGFGDDLSWVKGRHTFTFGGNIERSSVSIANHFMEPGSFSFSGDYSGLGVADFLFGKLRTFAQNNGEYKDLRNIFAGVYVQDDFRASRRLTLNLGLRYEPYFPWDEIKGRREWFSPAAYYAGRTSTQYVNAPPGLLFPGDPGVPERGTTGNYLDFAPRVGFAYDVTGSGRTSLRGGVGLFYDSHMNGNTDNYFVDVTPFSFSLGLTPPPGRFSDPLAGIQSPFPTPFPPPKDAVFPTPVQAYTFDTSGKFRPPVNYNWNLALEHQFGGNWFGRLAYAGSHASHILIYQELNPAIFSPGSSLSTDERRSLQPFGSITQFSPIGNSSYNSLQVTVEKRLGTSLPITLRANYTFSKSIDDVPLDGTYQAMPYFMPGAGQFERGLSDFDHPHRFVASYDWQLPRLHDAHPLLRMVLGSWETTGVFTAMSGNALTVTAGRDRSGTGIGQDRGDIVGQPYGPGACKNQAPCVNWLVPSSFKLPEPGTFGNIGKGSIRGPNLLNWDVGVFKNFPITERYRVQFRAEFFNVLNRTNFNAPTLSVNSGGFGAITSAQDPRIGQLALKVYF
jgi:Carboxypeptidase regulatory-like domain